MTLTDQEKKVLKALITVELEEIKDEGEDISLVNSPVLSSIYRMKETDLPFLKTKALYQQFLEDLLKKL